MGNSSDEPLKEQATEIMDRVEREQGESSKKGAKGESKGALARTASGGLGASQLLLATIFNAVNEADEAAAAARVAELREANEGITNEALVELLIKEKSQRTGMVGAAAAGSALIPGLGTLTAPIGVAADIGATFKLQAELVLEIAAVYNYPLSRLEKQQVVMLVTGVSAGGNQLLTRAGEQLSLKLTERFAQKWLASALPVLGVILSAGTNVLSTYIIGQRAQSYFALGPEAVGDWRASLRAISGVDERKITHWLAESAERSWSAMREGASSAREAVGDAAESVAGAGKRLAGGVVEGAQGAAEAVSERGRALASGVANAADAVGDRVGETFDDLRSGASSAARRVTGLFRRDEAQAAPPALPDGEATEEGSQASPEVGPTAKRSTPPPHRRARSARSRTYPRRPRPP